MNLLELLNGLDAYISASKYSLSTLKQLCIGLYEAGTVIFKKYVAVLKQENLHQTPVKSKGFCITNRLMILRLSTIL